MSDKPNISTVPEASYLSDYFEGERVRHEQELYGPYVRPLLGGGPMQPQVEAEGSWINRKHRKK